MAEKTEFDSRPSQISKDMQGSNSPVPLSPQWLFPKSGENKTGIATGENHFNPHSVYQGGSEPPKSPGIGEDVHDHLKKKDVFRPSVMDSDSARRDRWREEERDTNSSIRSGRWREGDKGLGDGRKVDRWTDSAGRHYGEARRVPAERFTDSGNRESNHDQRRESKWNTRWGPDNKEADGLREKWSDFSKDDDLPIEKGSSSLAYHGKDDREGDHYRPWRPNSSQSRGRVDPPHHLTLTPNKHVFTASHGRGRGENAPTFSHGRGRIPSVGSPMNDVTSHIQSHSVLSEKFESGHYESSPLRYTRTKLLNVYRTTDMGSSSKYFEGVEQIPSLMQEEPLEPLAICVPTAEELIILKGIDNGEVLSSGAPQINKDGSIGRNSTDFLQSRRNKQGSRNELQQSLDDSRDETIDNGTGGHSEPFYERQTHSESNSKFKAAQDYEKFSELKVNAEGVWRSPSIRERSHVASKEFTEIPGVVGNNIGWSGAQKGLADERVRSLPDSSYTKSEGLKWQLGNDPLLKRQHSSILDKELDKQKLSQPSPEDLPLYYKDPQGEIQGPFSGSDIIGWFEAGYFGLELLVRVVNAPPDTPFSQLGDVMPHLRAKARPPPGFGTPKSSTDASTEMNMNTFGMPHSGPIEIDITRSEQRFNHSSPAEAESRFLESLMSGSTSSAPFEKFVRSEGMPGYIGNTAGPVPSLGSESGDNLYLQAKKMTLERQRSVPNPYSYWPGRDAASIVPTPDVVHDSLPHSKPSLVADNARQQPHSQNVDLMAALLQGLPDRSASMNSGTSGWSNFPTQGGSENLQHRLEMHNGQRLNTQGAFGIQQPRMPAQNPPLVNFLGQTLDNPSNILAPEKLLSSGISQDPQMLNLLQLQYLLQLQTQTPLSPQQLLALENLLLKQQQQKQEQQQLVLQQQQLLSQMLSEHHSSQHFGEPSYGQLQTGGIPTGNVATDHAHLQQPSRELLNLASQTQVPARQEDRAPNFVFPTSIDVTHSVGSEPSSMHLQHQVFGDYHQRSSGNYQEQFASVQQRGSLVSTGVIDPSPGMEMINKYPLEHKSENIEPATVMSSVAALSLSPSEGLATSVDLPLPTSHESELTLDQQSEYVQPLPERNENPQCEGGKLSSDSSSVKEVKNIESSVKEVKNIESSVKDMNIGKSSEVKKPTEKKSKKQKSAKMQAVDTANGVSKSKQLKSSESKGANVSDAKSDIHGGPTGVAVASELETVERKNSKVAFDNVNVQLGENSLPANVTREGEHDETKSDLEQVGAVSAIRSQGVSGLRAWKPSPGFKPKSLLEIQEEEQRRAQAQTVVTEITSQNSVNVSTPWAGVMASSDQKHLRETELDTSNRELGLRKSDSFNQKSKKSQLHDVLAENFVAKPSEREEVVNIEPSLPAVPLTGSQADTGDDDAFIEAKDTKRSRKKSAKAKAAASKTSAPVASMEISTGSSPMDKVKISRHVQMEKDVLPTVPAGPSLGDFVIWKGETANTSAAPAWSEPGKTPKPTSLRDILKEQEKKGSTGPQNIPVPTPQKSVPTQPARGGSGSWSVTASSPSKAATPIQMNLQAASQSKNQVEDDFFWGPIDQPKQDAKQSDFPHLGNHGSRGVKNTPVKGTLGGSSSKQKSIGRPMERVLSSSPASAHSSLKGKKDFQTKQSEAMDFREWCESECARLIGTKDTSFLEFCLKQSRSEAETLLVENLGSFDPDHKFIEKFLNYKDFLPSDVLDIAFQKQNDRKITGKGAGDVTSVPVGVVESGVGNAGAQDVTSKGGGGGKKKGGKKGKKVNLSELGFNVVSNRIMMGEIQSIED